MRLPSFPVPVYGETVTSVVARYLARAGIVAGRHLDMLGLKRASATAVAPVGLDALIGGVPDKHPWCNNGVEVIRQHTAVPWYLYFSGENHAKLVITRLVDSGSINPAASLGLTQLAMGRPEVKFCPVCVETDSKSRGFPVAYREHQIPYVKVCATHECSLHRGCTQCSEDSKAISAWKMAGMCGCAEPSTEPVCSQTLGADTLKGLLWISRQVSWTLSRESVASGASRAQLLLEGLKAQGFAGRNGLDSDQIKRALVKRFGAGFFRTLDEVNLVDDDGKHRWPARLLSPAAIGGDRIVESLRALLLASLVCDHISGLRAADASEKDLPVSPVEPRGYGKKRLTRDLLDADSIEAALVLKGGRLPAAAELLGVSPARLAVDLQHLGMRCPLSASTRKRLGDQVIAEAMDALRSGVPKKQIMERLLLSEWSLQLIELDDPSLSSAHQEATVARQQDCHRAAILEYLQRHPTASRSALAKDRMSACDWLGRFDSEWLALHWPACKVARRSAARAARKDWAVIDEALVDSLDLILQEELSQKDRPIWLSATALMRLARERVGCSTLNACRTPKIFQAAQFKAEGRRDFERRKIRWAMGEHARTHTPVSMNTLRRTAGMLPAVLIANKEWVQECAAELELSVDARCALSMHR